MNAKREFMVEFQTACGCSRMERMMLRWPPPDRLTRSLRIPFNANIFELSLENSHMNRQYVERSFALKSRQGPVLIYEEELMKA